MKLERKEFNVLRQGQSGGGNPPMPPSPKKKGDDIIPPEDGDDNSDGGDSTPKDGDSQNKSRIEDISKGQKSDDKQSGEGSGGDGDEKDGEGKGKGKGKPGEGESGSGAGDSGEEGDGKGKDGKGKGQGAKPGDGKTDGKGTPVDVSGRGVGGIVSPEESRRMQEDLGVPYEAPFNESEVKEKLREMYPMLDKNPGAKNFGGGAGGVKRILPKVVAGILNPVVDWKGLLKKFIARALGRRDEDILPNRRHAAGGDYFQGTRELNNNFSTCVIAVDTSGSMGTRELLSIVTEIKGLAKTNRINNFDVVFFDTVIHDVQHLTSEKVKAWDPHMPGQGGTDFRAPLEYMEKIRKTGKLDLAIFMTDGYADLNLPVPRYKDKFIWCILDNPTFKAPWGSKLVHIDVPKGKG